MHSEGTGIAPGTLNQKRAEFDNATCYSREFAAVLQNFARDGMDCASTECNL